MTAGAGKRGERGAALVAVLFALLVCELAVFAAVSEIRHVQERFVLDRDRTAASRLAESGYVHALAVIARGPGPPRRVEAALAEGRYEAEIRLWGKTSATITATGQAWSSRRVTLTVRGRIEHGYFLPTWRSWRHDGP